MHIISSTRITLCSHYINWLALHSCPCRISGTKLLLIFSYNLFPKYEKQNGWLPSHSCPCRVYITLQQFMNDSQEWSFLLFFFSVPNLASYSQLFISCHVLHSLLCPIRPSQGRAHHIYPIMLSYHNIQIKNTVCRF